MRGLLDITNVNISRSVIDGMQQRLAEHGRRGEEAFALWAGQRTDSVFTVQEAIIPRQFAGRMGRGVYVEVPGEELHRINVYLYEQQWQLLAQVHTHPTNAFHSDTDDAYPLVATVGAFSIVIPDFAARQFDWRDVAVYRLSELNRWVGQTTAQVAEVFREVQ